ncbi:MAG TPA: hypothetical protein VM409_05625, partial [Chloroflexia bacterium]|nr:hypothetical protein [Chloroflexia bacterium]
MAGGLLLRLIFFAGLAPSSGFPYILDEGNYVDLAVPLSQGMGFVEKWVWLRPPGYPAFVASFLVAGGTLSDAILAQILLSVANIGVIYAVAVEVFARRPDVPRGKAEAAGLMAAGLTAANPHIVLYANLFMVETPYMLAFSVILWVLLRVRRAWSAWSTENPQMSGLPPRRVLLSMGIVGFVAAAAILVRSLLLTFMPLLLAWFWWILPRPEGTTRRLFPGRRWNAAALSSIAVLVVVMFLTIAPWTIRNYVRYDRFLLVDAVGGHNLWQYNDKIGRDEIVARLAAIPNPVDRDRYASEQGVRAIMADPLSFARDAAERFGDSWPVEHFNEYRVSIKNKFPGVDCTWMDLYAWLGTGFYLGLGLLTLWGFFIAPGRAVKGLFLLSLLHYLVTSMLTHVEFRYRIPLYPFMSLYGGWALMGMLSWRRRPGLPKQAAPGTRKAGLASAGLLSLLFTGQCLLFMLPGLTSSIRFERRYTAGKSLMAAGSYEAALAEFEGAEQVDRSCACLFRDMGLVYGKLGRADEERAAYTTAISREEQDWRTRALLSDRLRSAGDRRFAGPLRTTRPEFRLEQLAWAWDNLAPPLTSTLDIGGNDLGYIKGF